MSRDTPNADREFQIRRHPENATVYDVNYLIHQLEVARRESDDDRDTLAKVRELAEFWIEYNPNDRWAQLLCERLGVVR